MIDPVTLQSIAAARGAKRIPISAPQISGTGSDSFASMITGAVETLKKSEATSIAGLKGEVQTRQAVDAILTAERTLQTVIAVRDKFVSAYQEVSRMQI